MKICGHWNEEQARCDLLKEDNCENCQFYESQTDIKAQRFQAAKTLAKLPIEKRKSIYEKYYSYLSEEMKMKYYVKVWWNECLNQ